MAVFWNRPICDLRDETERPFRSDHQMLEDVERLLEVDKRVERITRRILDCEFTSGACGELFVGARLNSEGGERIEQGGMACGERGAALVVAGVRCHLGMRI